MFWLRDRSDDGILGRSRMSRAPDVLNAAAGLQGFATALWANAATPSGVVDVPTTISPSGLRRLREHIEGQAVGASNARRLLFVDQGHQIHAARRLPRGCRGIGVAAVHGRGALPAI